MLVIDNYQTCPAPLKKQQQNRSKSSQCWFSTPHINKHFTMDIVELICWLRYNIHVFYYNCTCSDPFFDMCQFVPDTVQQFIIVSLCYWCLENLHTHKQNNARSDCLDAAAVLMSLEGLRRFYITTFFERKSLSKCFMKSKAANASRIKYKLIRNSLYMCSAANIASDAGVRLLARTFLLAR